MALDTIRGIITSVIDGDTFEMNAKHMGKLLPRLEAGRSGGCPVLVFGITTALLKK